MENKALTAAAFTKGFCRMRSCFNAFHICVHELYHADESCVYGLPPLLCTFTTTLYHIDTYFYLYIYDYGHLVLQRMWHTSFVFMFIDVNSNGKKEVAITCKKYNNNNNIHLTK